MSSLRDITVEVPQKAIRLGSEIEISILVPDGLGYVNKVILLSCKHGDKEQRRKELTYVGKCGEKSKFFAKVNFLEVGINYFYFEMLLNGQKVILKYNYKTEKPDIYAGNLWKVTVFDNEFETPNWVKGKIIYHLFVDRFCRSDKYIAPAMPGRTQLYWKEIPVWRPNLEGEIKNEEFFMGNLLGIKDKLDYLVELGVEILYLSPICRSQSNHRYDTANYQEIDPYAGNTEIMKNLCEEAHKRGMYVILDSVFNHTGNDSIYFNEFGNYDGLGAFQSNKSEYSEFYKKDSNGNYQFWWGFKNLPECNCNSEKWIEFICGIGGVIDNWFSWGIDGLRLDVADELTDEFIEKIRVAVHRNKKDGYIVGEVWENAIEKEKDGKKRKYLLGKGMDSVMNYPVSNAILKYIRFGDIECFKGTLNEILTQYPQCSIDTLMTGLSTHDITRAITTLAGEGIENIPYKWVWDFSQENRVWQFEHDHLNEKYELGKKRLKLATIVQYFLPGNPCIFYGDEAGLNGYKDPFNRKAFPWGNEDKELQKFFKTIGQIKKKIKDIYKFDFEIVEITEDLLVFKRSNKKNGIIIIINRSEFSIKYEITEKVKEFFNMNCDFEIIGPYGAKICKI